MTSNRFRGTRAATAANGHPDRGPATLPYAAIALLACGALAVSSPAAALERLAEPLHVVFDTWNGAFMRGPLAIVLDPQRQEILLANTNANRVEVYDFEGFSIGSFVHVVERDGATQDGFPKWLAVDSTGRILLGDQLASYVDVLDYAGRSEHRLALPAPDDALDAGNGPGAIAVARDGRILVASRGERGRVYEFDRTYAFIRAWGDSGAAAGRLSAITGLCEAPNGDIWVTCARTDLAVQVFDAKGRFLRGLGKHDIGTGNFSFPSGITVTADGRVWVSDEIRQVIQVFDSAGTYLGVVGGAGKGRGEFLYPSSIATDGRQFLAVAERGGNRFQIFKLH